MTQNSFETPKEMRELAAKNIAQTQAAFQQFTDAMSQAMGMWSKAIPANQMTSRFTVVQDWAARFAKQNTQAVFTLASDIAKARHTQEVLSPQSRSGRCKEHES